MSDIMSEVAADEAGTHRGPIGCVERIARDHPDLVGDAVKAVNSNYPATSVARVLRGRGVDISDYTVMRHRRGDCRCKDEYRV